MTNRQGESHELRMSDTTVWPAGDGEELQEGGTWLLDLVATVDHLARGHRHDFTVWDAFEEAIRWWVAEQQAATEGVVDPEFADLPWDAPDPLRATVQDLLDFIAASEVMDLSCALQVSVRRWVIAMATRFNDGQSWPHPIPRRAFPPMLLPSPEDAS